MTPQEARQTALKAIEERIMDGRYTRKAQIDYFLYINFGLGITTSNRFLDMLESLGKITISEDGEIRPCQTG